MLKFRFYGDTLHMSQQEKSPEVLKCFIYRFLLDHRKSLLNVNCGVKVVIICM